MDYNRMLFAFHVRELTVARLVAHRPRDVPEEEQDRWMLDRFNGTAELIVRELNEIADVIDKASGV
jgi:hypothetical protein